jgi:hypothetical protein
MMNTRAICILSALFAAISMACADSAGQDMTSEMAIEPPKPILEGYTADPHAVVFGDTFYVYPTSDKGEWQTTDFSTWSSKDLLHWKNEGIILDVRRI